MTLRTCHYFNLSMSLGLLLMALCTTPQASLLGDDVVMSFLDVQSTSAPPTVLDTRSFVVSATETEVQGLFNAFNVDVGADTIRVDIIDSGPLPSALFLGFLFEDLLESDEITGFSSAATDISGFTGNRLLQAAHEIAFDFQGLLIQNGNFLEVGLNFKNNSIEVHEPLAFLMSLLFIALCIRLYKIPIARRQTSLRIHDYTAMSSRP